MENQWDAECVLGIESEITTMKQIARDYRAPFFESTAKFCVPPCCHKRGEENPQKPIKVVILRSK